MWNWRAILLVPAFVAAGCASVATRPGEILPNVELQINNTPTQSDDYVPGGGTIPARVRVTNVDTTINIFGPIHIRGVAADVPVEITNMDRNFGGQLLFGTSCNSLSGSAFVTIPKDGSWVNLCLGTQTPSSVDKDAVIQIHENRNDGVVLGRFPVQAGGANPNVPAASQIEMGFGIFNGVGTLDTYVGWVPRLAWIRLANGGGPVTVRVSNAFAASATRGRLIFAPTQPGNATPQPAAMTATLNLTLSGTTVVNFWIAGVFGSPSTRDKDAVIEVDDAVSGNLMGRSAVMVRIRKDGNTLTSDERDRFLRALVKLNGSQGGGTFSALGQNYFNFQDVHNQIGPNAHSFFPINPPNPNTPAFMPWHRIFILRLERELQALDPSVALPWWNFSETDPAKVPVNIFNTAFMGQTNSPSLNATFDPSNPMAAWATRWPTFASPTVTGVRRFPRFAPNQLPTSVATVYCSAPDTESNVLNYGTPFLSATTGSTTGFSRMEWRAHNVAHVTAGGLLACNGGANVAGWLTTLNQPIQDPLFFMLHTNVDRLWARWQQQNGRWDPLNTDTYPNQGTAGTGQRVGQFMLDLLFPWGTSGAPGGQFPQTIGQINAPPAQPIILNSIDYQQEWSMSGSNPQHGTVSLGFDYADVPYNH